MSSFAKICSREIFEILSFAKISSREMTKNSFATINSLKVHLKTCFQRIHKTLYISVVSVKVVSATFLLVCFLSVNESHYQIRKNTFCFTLKALFVLEKIKF